MRNSGGPLRGTAVTRPAGTILFADSPWGDTEIDWKEIDRGGPFRPMGLREWTGVAADGMPLGRWRTGLAIPVFTAHNGLVSFLFADGHVKALKVARTFGTPPDRASEMWGMEVTRIPSLRWQGVAPIATRLSRMHEALK